MRKCHQPLSAGPEALSDGCKSRQACAWFDSLQRGIGLSVSKTRVSFSISSIYKCASRSWEICLRIYGLGRWTIRWIIHFPKAHLTTGREPKQLSPEWSINLTGSTVDWRTPKGLVLAISWVMPAILINVERMPSIIQLSHGQEISHTEQTRLAFV